MSDRPCAEYAGLVGGQCVHCGFFHEAHPMRGSGGAREGSGEPRPETPGPSAGEGSPTAPPANALAAAPAPSPPLSAEGEQRVRAFSGWLAELVRQAEHRVTLFPASGEGMAAADALSELSAGIVDAVRGLVAEREQLAREVADHAAWAREYGKTPDGAAWVAEIRRRDAAEAQVEALRAALRERGVHAASCATQLVADRASTLARYWYTGDEKVCTCAMRVLAEETG